mgnify:CR=1 FL=1
MDVTEIGYGLNQVHDNMLVWMYDVIGGNSAQGDRLLFSFIMYLAQRHTKLSTSRIGMLVGGRNHATVLHAITQVKNRMATTPVYAQQVAEVEKQLRGRK